MAAVSCIAVFDDPENGLKGNIAAVVWTDSQPNDSKMQEIAADLRQPATTFLWPEDNNTIGVRWFAPDAEIGLCGHGTLAAVAAAGRMIKLHYKHGMLSGWPENDGFATMKIGAIRTEADEDPPVLLEEALGVKIEGYFKTANKDIVLLENEDALVNMSPDFAELRKIDVFGYSITAPGDQCDYVSRTLVPHVSQLEDHATGSSHAALAPFWAKRLNRNVLKAIQRSPRGGRFNCTVENDSVLLTGHFTVILRGEITAL